MITNKWYAMNPNLGLLFIRIALGVVFIFSGFGKFMAIAGTTKFFASLGLAPFWVYVVATVELIGGIAMILGVWTMIVGLLLAINMFFAIVLVKFAMGFAAGYRLEFVLLLVALGIACTGPGSFALHQLGNKTKI